MEALGHEDLVLGPVAGEVNVAGGAGHGEGAFLLGNAAPVDLIRVRVAERPW